GPGPGALARWWARRGQVVLGRRLGDRPLRVRAPADPLLAVVEERDDGAAALGDGVGGLVVAAVVAPPRREPLGEPLGRRQAALAHALDDHERVERLGHLAR